MLMTRENDYVIFSGEKNAGCSMKAGAVGSQFNTERNVQKKIGRGVNTAYLCVVGLWVIIHILFNSVQCL